MTDNNRAAQSLTISIVTPSFNQGRFIERTINTVLSQGIEDLEYFIADGGSSDETVDIMRRYQDRLSFVSEKDKGQANAVNKGIMATSGDIIGWLNSDDIYYPGTLVSVLDYFKEHPEADVVYGDAYHIDENDNILEPYYTEDWDYERLKDVCFLCQPAVFFRRRLITRTGLLDESLSYCMDYEFWLRLGKIVRFGRLHRFFAGSRMYSENKTLGSRVAVHREINDMFRKVGDVPDKWIYAYSHCMVEDKGFTRDSAARNIRFIIVLIWVVLFSFFRWKHRLPVSAMRTMTGWAIAFFKNLMK